MKSAGRLSLGSIHIELLAIKWTLADIAKNGCSTIFGTDNANAMAKNSVLTGPKDSFTLIIFAFVQRKFTVIVNQPTPIDKEDKN